MCYMNNVVFYRCPYCHRGFYTKSTHLRHSQICPHKPKATEAGDVQQSAANHRQIVQLLEAHVGADVEGVEMSGLDQLAVATLASAQLDNLRGYMMPVVMDSVDTQEVIIQRVEASDLDTGAFTVVQTPDSSQIVDTSDVQVEMVNQSDMDDSNVVDTSDFQVEMVNQSDMYDSEIVKTSQVQIEMVNQSDTHDSQIVDTSDVQVEMVNQSNVYDSQTVDTSYVHVEMVNQSDMMEPDDSQIVDTSDIETTQRTDTDTYSIIQQPDNSEIVDEVDNVYTIVQPDGNTCGVTPAGTTWLVSSQGEPQWDPSTIQTVKTIQGPDGQAIAQLINNANISQLMTFTDHLHLDSSNRDQYIVIESMCEDNMQQEHAETLSETDVQQQVEIIHEPFIDETLYQDSLVIEDRSETV